MKSQKEIFLQSEADKSFKRNSGGNYLVLISGCLDKVNLNILKIRANVRHLLNYLKNMSAYLSNLFPIEPLNLDLRKNTTDILKEYDEAFFDIILLLIFAYIFLTDAP